jgi:hypothetical protein
VGLLVAGDTSLAYAEGKPLLRCTVSGSNGLRLKGGRAAMPPMTRRVRRST